MKVTDKLIEETIKEISDEDTLKIVKLIKNRKNVSEVDIAEKFKKRVNDIRQKLYILYQHSLVSFTRKKDKKKGWYIYYWTFNKERLLDLAIKLKKERLQRLEERLEREKSDVFFMCKNECMRLNFEQALNFSFKCPECGSLLEQQDNKKIIKQLEQEIKKLKKELKIKG